MTKHPNSQVAKDISNNLKCVVCEDKFETRNDFNIHLEKHLEEIRDFGVKDWLNGHEQFKCNTCDYISTNHNVIKMHLIKHVNESLPSDAKETNENEIEQTDLVNAEYKTNEDKSNSYEAFIADIG